MDAWDELAAALGGGARVVVVSDGDIDLRPTAGDCRLFILKIAEGSLAAGGRGGGFGERRVVMVAGYSRTGGAWSKNFETTDEGAAGLFEVPYYVSRIPVLLKDGTETMGYGVVDRDLVAEMEKKAGSSSLA